MNEVNKIAGKHLGKTTNYEDAKAISPELLVAIPRSKSREDSNITVDHLFDEQSVDVWTAYEFSTLLSSGLPTAGILKIVIPATSEFLVESKSLKLYLNSYNSVHYSNSKQELEAKLEEDIGKIIGKPIQVGIHPAVSAYRNARPAPSPMLPPVGTRITLEDNVEIASEYGKITDGNLSLVHSNWGTQFITKETKEIHTTLLRSALQGHARHPDWGDLYIQVVQG